MYFNYHICYNIFITTVALEEYMSIIGTNIKKIRMKQNLSAKQLAKKCGISETALLEIEDGKKVPTTQLTNLITKGLGVNIDAIEPSYFSDYFEENPVPKEAPVNTARVINAKQTDNKQSNTNTISDALSKAVKKIPVLSKVTAGKSVPFEGDIVDSKFEPVFQGKANNVAGEEFVYYMVSDNSMQGARIMKSDLALVFLTDSIRDKDIVLFTYKNNTYIRRYKSVSDNIVALIAENADYDTFAADKKDLRIVGKVLRVEFKI
jgi:transcriptional regulator with XRE-family HTH domain